MTLESVSNTRVDVGSVEHPMNGIPLAAISLHVHSSLPVELVDITDQVGAALVEIGVVDGAALLFCGHTSCGLLINENETGMKEDLLAVLAEIAPAQRRWAHNDMSRRWENLIPDEKPNGHSHVLAVLATHPSLVVPVRDSQPRLGCWQRIFLLELDGPRNREVLVQAGGVTPFAAPAVHRNGFGGKVS